MLSPFLSWLPLLRDRWFYGLIVTSLLAITLAYQTSPAFQLDLRAPDHARLIEGFFEPGQTPTGTVRWSKGRADIRLFNFYPGQSVKFTVTLSAPRQDEPDPVKREEPVYADLLVNYQPVAHWLIEASPKEYPLDIPAEVVGWDGNFVLTLQSPTFTPPNDLRSLGLLLGGLTVHSTSQAPHWPSPTILIGMTGLVALLNLWLRRLQVMRWGALSVALLLLAVGVSSLLLARPFVLPILGQLWLWFGLTVLASELARKFGAINTVRTYRLVALLFLCGFGLRLWIAQEPGDYYNFVAFKMMIENVTKNGISAAYQLDPIIGAYPPVHHYFFLLPGHLYRLFVSPDFDLSSLRLDFMLKLPTLVLDVVIALVILVYGLQSERADDAKPATHSLSALLAVAAYLFNPGIIFTTAYHGQLGDPLYTLFILAAVLGLLAKSGAVSGAATALAILTKPQSSAFLPFLLVAAFCHLPRRQLLRGIAVGIFVVLLVLLPFLWAGTLDEMIRTVSTTIGHGPRITSHAFNLWWLVGWGKAWEIKDTGKLIGAITYRHVGLLLFFGLAYGFILWRSWQAKQAKTLALLAAFTGLSFFLLPTEIHENYLFPTIPLLVVATLYERNAWLPLLVLSTTWFLNLTTTYEALLPRLAELSPTLFVTNLFQLQVLSTVINLVVWAGIGMQIVRSSRSGGSLWGQRS